MKFTSQLLRISSLTSLLLITPYLSALQLGKETLGQLEVSDILLRPNVQLQESRKASFSLGESSFEVTWRLDEALSGHFRVGSRPLINQTARYSDTVNNDLMLVEAFAEWAGPYGRFRLGRISLEYGAEGSWLERDLMFSRSMIFSKRVVALRDDGFSYEIENNGWFTNLSVTNGESDQDLDGRLWQTGRWGYRQGKILEVGLMGQAGGTNTGSTVKTVGTGTSAVQTPTSDTTGGFNANENSKWRMGGVFAQWYPRWWQVILEGTFGECVQSNGGGKFSVGHIDVVHQLKSGYLVGVRADHFDPNSNKDGDRILEASLLAGVENATRTSSVLLIGTKVFQEGNSSGNDRLLLVWRLSAISKN